jgi:hypothetical protein
MVAADVLGPLFRVRGHRPGEEASDGSMEVREPSFVSSPEDDGRNADVRCAQRIHNPVSLPSADRDPATNFDRGGL